MITTDIKFLSQSCDPISDIDNEGLPLLDLLHKELVSSPSEGIGLAANQIGIRKKAFVMQLPVGDGRKFAYGFLNPEIVSKSEPIIFKEGCLSFDEQEVETFRFGKVVVKDLLAPDGRKFEGLAAVVCQHEIDHTIGRTMFDAQYSKIKLDSNCPCGSERQFRVCCRPKVRRM